MAGLARDRACGRCTHRADADTHRDRFGNQTFPDPRRRIRLRRPALGRRPRLSRWIYLPERCRRPLTKQSSRPLRTGAMPLPNLSLWFYVSFQILSILRQSSARGNLQRTRYFKEFLSLLVIAAGLSGLIYFKRF